MKKYTITSKAGMPPFSTTTTRAAAEADSREARQLGLDGEIIEEPTQKSYQQIAGDATTDRAVGGDTAPASPAHTPEPWTANDEITGGKVSIYANGPLGYIGENPEANAARICACVNACAGMTDPEVEIKALRDALDSINRALSTPPLMTREAQDGFSYHSAEEAYRVELCRLIIETRDTARAALKGATK